MLLKLSQIINSVSALEKLSEEKLPARIAYSIQRNIRLLQPDIESYEKTRINLIKEKYGEKIDDGYKVPDNKLEAFAKELIDLQSVDLEIDIHKIDLDNSIQISVNDMLALEWMFSESSEEIK